jgi:tetratricopeptide (TPR) repeat protein
MIGVWTHRWRALVVAGTIAVGLFRANAEPGAEAAFEAANQLYAQNKFAEAAAAYDQLSKSNGVSGPLLFNLGNAHYKSGQIGLAIAAYRQAALLSPRDTDVRANLQFVRGQIQGPTLRPNAVERSLGIASPNEWAGLAAGALWLTFGLLILKELRPALAAPLRLATRTTALLTCALAGALAYSVRPQAAIHTVVVIARETPVRITPHDEARAAFTVNDGAELRVLDRKNDWLQVTDGSARNHGWIHAVRLVSP